MSAMRPPPWCLVKVVCRCRCRGTGHGARGRAATTLHGGAHDGRDKRTTLAHRQTNTNEARAAASTQQPAQRDTYTPIRIYTHIHIYYTHAGRIAYLFSGDNDTVPLWKGHTETETLADLTYVIPY